MSLESQFKSKVLLETIEPLTVIKKEPEIGMDQDIISADIKHEIDIEYNIVSEDLIKNEPNPNLLKSEHLESVETQIFIQTENTPFIKTEFENLVKTENSGRNLGVVSGGTHKKRKSKMDNCRLKHHCNKCKYKTLWRTNLEKHKLIHLKPEEIQYFYCYHCSFKAKQKNHLKIHILGHFKREEIPFHCYICDFVRKKRDLIIEHFKKHPEHIKKYELTQESKVEIDDQYLKYQCDKCTYKTFRKESLKNHKLIHLKPEEIQWFYCYHCSYKSKRKDDLKYHIFNHFKNEVVTFHCYICDFVTKKRDLIIEHFKKHPEHVSKCDETDYEIHLKLTPNIKRSYNCKKCAFRAYQYEKFNLHELTHKTEVEMDDRYLKYQCDKCTYKTFRITSINRHKLNHLKLEEIQWFYCYHCSYKTKQKCHLKGHILRHFKNEVVKFHCYMCNFVTKKRDLIMEHFKKHPEYVSKCDQTDYEINLLQLTPKIKKRMAKSEKITEKRRKQQRDSMRRRRERIKSNPNLYEEAKAKERENYQKRKKKQ